MYNRFERRKNPPKILFKGCGGLTDAFDDAFKESFMVTDEEFDTLAGEFNDDELGYTVADPNTLSYKDAKKLHEAINRYI